MPGENTIDELKIEIIGEEKGAGEKIQDVTDRLKTLSKQMSSTDRALKRMQETTAKGVKIDFNIKKASEKLSRIEERLRALKNTKGTFSIDTTPAENAVKSLSKKVSLPETKTALNDASFNDMVNVGNIFQNTDAVRELREEVDNTGKSLSGVGGAFNIFSRGTSKAVMQFEKLNTGSKSFFASIKRIAMYRLIRSSLKLITEGFREGVQNAYQFSKINGTGLSKSLDRAATSSLYLKNSLGALAAPLIEAVTPAIEWITDKVVDLINTVNEFVAKVSGKATWMKAVKYPVAFAENAKDATGAVKELKATILGIDEINPLNGNFSGGNGLSSAAKDYSSMFKEVKTSGALNDFELSFKNVLFKWENLNAEDISQKLFAGLFGILGGIAGFSIGGPAGAIVGTLAGVGLGILFDSMVFDNDGKLGEDEVIKMLGSVAFLLSGGIIGAVVGGPVGALVGSIAGAALSIAFSKLDLKRGDGTTTADKILKALYSIVGGMIGGTVGFILGGPVGQIVGTLEGVKLGLTFNDFMAKQEGSFKEKFRAAAIGIWNQFVSDVISAAGGDNTFLGRVFSKAKLDPDDSIKKQFSQMGIKLWNAIVNGLQEKTKSSWMKNLLEHLKIPESWEAEGKKSGHGFSLNTVKTVESGLSGAENEITASWKNATAGIKDKKFLITATGKDTTKTDLASYITTPASRKLIATAAGKDDTATTLKNYLGLPATKKGTATVTGTTEDLKTKFSAYLNLPSTKKGMATVSGSTDDTATKLKTYLNLPVSKTLKATATGEVKLPDLQSVETAGGSLTKSFGSGMDKYSVKRTASIVKPTDVDASSAGSALTKNYLNGMIKNSLTVKASVSRPTNADAITDGFTFTKKYFDGMDLNTLKVSAGVSRPTDQAAKDQGAALTKSYKTGMDSVSLTKTVSLVQPSTYKNPWAYGQSVATGVKNGFNSVTVSKSVSITQPSGYTSLYNYGSYIGNRINEGFNASFTGGGFKFDMSTINGATVMKFKPMAEGGYLNVGEVFVARERGPEMVGTIGNRSAVANTQQIVTGIANGVYEGNREQNVTLQEILALLAQIAANQNGGSGDGTTGGSLTDFARANRRAGKTLIPVSR